MNSENHYGKDSINTLISNNKNKSLNVLSTFIVNSAHTDLKNHKSSCNFIVKIPGLLDLKNIDSVTFLGGTIPNFISPNIISQVPYLLLEITEINGFVNSNSLSNRVFSLMYWDTGAIVANSNFLTIKPSHVKKNPIQNIGKLLNLSIKILDPDGEVFSFGNDILNVTSFTNTNPSTITTTINHGLTTGDSIVIKCFNNASNKNTEKFITTSKGFIVTVTGVNTFTIPLDLSTQSVNQNLTSDESAYNLGINSNIIRYPNGNLSNNFRPTLSTYSTANPTTINIGNIHGLVTGQQIKIANFDNGSSFLINQLINNVHTVTVTGVNTFTIPVDLSAQAATQQKTGTRNPFTLGSESKIIIKNLQISLNLLFESKNKDWI
jgi:hypothetical protein